MCAVPVWTVRGYGMLLVLPLRVYRLTVYIVLGCKPKKKKKINTHILKKNRSSKISLRELQIVKVQLTGESVGVCFSWDGPGDGGIRSAVGIGFNKVTSDGFQLGTPEQCERSICDIWHTHAARRTHSCIRGGKEASVKKDQYAISDVWRCASSWCSWLPCSVVASATAGLLVTEFFRA